MISGGFGEIQGFTGGRRGAVVAFKPGKQVRLRVLRQGECGGADPQRLQYFAPVMEKTFGSDIGFGQFAGFEHSILRHSHFMVHYYGYRKSMA
ncbi:hypothetical protein D3C80_1919860 [compost metagenome]